jgi:hypothetical protein
MPIAHRRTPATRVQQRPRAGALFVPLPGVERALVVAKEPKGDMAHPAEQSVAGTGVARMRSPSGG